MGLPLLAYSIGHEIILWRENNPLVTRERDVLREDVAAAAFVCCQTWEESQSAGWLYNFIRIKAWNFRTRKLNAATEALKFDAYRREALSLPHHYMGNMPKGTAVRMTGTPMIFQLFRFVMGLGYTEAQARNYPLAMARWHWLASEESKGNLCVESEYDAHIKRLQKGEFQCQA